MVATTEWRSEVREIAGARLHLVEGGHGRPLLVLHGEEGTFGWRPYHEALAAQSHVLAPTHPGFGQSTRPEWLTSVQRLAQLYLWFLDEMKLDQVDLMGCSLGGWIAAEMVIQSPARFARLVLVSPMGIYPEQGEIEDIFLSPYEDIIRLSFHDPDGSPEYTALWGHEPSEEELGDRLSAREMAARLGYKPYMHDRYLPALLGRVSAPTLIIWGAQDAIVPVSVAQMWQQSIAGARLATIDNCGHLPHFENPHELARLALEFINA